MLEILLFMVLCLVICNLILIIIAINIYFEWQTDEMIIKNVIKILEETDEDCDE